MKNESLAHKILTRVAGLPYFSVDNLKNLGEPDYQIKIALARLFKKCVLIRLKKGLYVAKEYVDEIKINEMLNSYIEFISTKIYELFYLSLAYVFYAANILTEIPVNFAFVTKNKTLMTYNKLGRFIYHKIKDHLFCGFQVKKQVASYVIRQM